MPTETLPIPTDAGARDALLERVRTLTSLRHPCVEPVVAADVGDDGSLVLRRGGGATDLPTVLAVRGRLTSREASGVLVAVARGLAALHSADLRQGSLRAQDVVLAPGGDALLRPRAAPGGGSPDGVGADGGESDPVAGEAGDVHALATLVAELLGDRSDDDAVALRAVLAPASAPDPRVRPEAGTLAAQADAAVPGEPVRLPEPAALAAASLGRRPPTPEAGQGPASAAGGRGRRRAVRHTDGRAVGRPPSRSSRRLLPSRRALRPRRALGVVSVVGAVGVVGVLTAVALQVQGPGDAAGPGAGPGESVGQGAVTAQDAASPAAPDPTQERADPASAAAELTRRRVVLLADGATDCGALGAVDLPGSAAHEADAALLEEAERAGTRVRGAEARVEGARVERDLGDEADVVVRYVVGAHEQVAADGTVTAVPATDVRSATLRLAWTSDGWRVAEVS
ncbi:hypothetical protein ACH436_02265 [Isoptericola sp. NPDC019693]|uniref:hypothetical protein n=1 Tax=Isoptericola sp. NPDC019693 TaxID=3364009 RepID=UPI0037A87C37